MFGNYCLVGNFCKGFIFVFFISRKLFAKIKTGNFLCPLRLNDVSSWHYFKLCSCPNFNTSLSASVPLMAIAQVNWEVRECAQQQVLGLVSICCYRLLERQ